MENKQRGLIGIIVLIVIALILLKYFLNWSIFDAAASDQGKSTILYIRDVFNTVWHYIAGPITFIWNQIIKPIVDISWKNFQAIIHMGQNVGPNSSVY
ncbi:MAG: hypothetical protein JWL80_539 [Parcubacteria group bacterium]|nr:hypothetical protein [Parcubacteria group bacterium]